MKVSMIVALVAVLSFVGSALGQEGAESPSPGLKVEADVCNDVKERMPVGPADSFPADVGTIYLWCRVTGAADSTSISHVWLHKEEVMATVELPVNSIAWRTWSSKTILPEWTGQWEVRILDAAGRVLKALPFSVGATAAAEPAPEKAPVDTADTVAP